MTRPRRMVDAHIHLWDPTVLAYPWLEADPLLRRPFLPVDLQLDLQQGGGPQDWVMVQAEAHPEQSLGEVEWISDLAVSEPALRGMVVRAPVEIGRAVGDHLEQLATYPITVGVRRLIQHEPSGFARTASFIDGVRAVGDFGWPFDICVRALERQDVAPLVDACPDVSFVLDHMGKPDIANGEWEPWRGQLADLARRPNVVCKLSGSTSEAGPAWHEDTVRPYLEHALATFGPMRCMFGSDWPVATLTTAYPRWLDLVTDVVAGCSDSEIEAVFAGTAERIYELSPHS